LQADRREYRRIAGHGLNRASAPSGDIYENLSKSTRFEEPEAGSASVASVLKVQQFMRPSLRQSREQLELPDEMPGGDPIEAETFAVLEVIRRLPEAYRDTLLMRLVEGMSGQEIADRTGLAPGSVRVNLHRGMKLLREKLEWHHE
jgi:RNA polymerase sigma factor (sigma-70 family)